MDKVKLTKAQAWHLENLREHHSERDIVATAINDPGITAHVKGGINSIDHDTLIRALYIGYEVEQTLEEKLHEAFEDTPPSLPNPSWTDEDNVRMSYQCGFRTALRTAGIKVPGINN
ncbi:hypothetical protein MKX59_19505 [Paenibacillus sp. FSL R7-0340]|uniref:hypothetical protein n=1 Tax=Paenibacillus sp. FSL R7-0340 TaxID=2921684 RepID=UPI0030F816EC